MAKATKKPTTKKVVVENADVSILMKQNIVHALAYVPYFIGAVAMFFLGKTNKDAAMHHIKYSALLAAAVIILSFVLNGFFIQLLALIYLVGSGYLAWKAYKGEDVKIEILDTVEDKIAKSVKK
jgi:uncharacterized membrane protein